MSGKPAQTQKKLHWFIKFILWGIAIMFAAPMILGSILLYFLSQPDDRLKLTDYTELKELLSDPNARSDGKTLPSYDSVTTDTYWFRDYEGKIPTELRQENIIIAENTDGFTDLVHIGLFQLNDANTQSLTQNLGIMFTKYEEGTDINWYAENALCLNHVDLGPWVIASTRKDEFFDFCLSARKTKKVSWELVLHDDDGIGFEYINVTQYAGSNFFTVTHGGS